MTKLNFEYDNLTEEFICELDDKTVMIIAGGNRGKWAHYFNAQKPTDTVTLSKAEYDALVADAERYRWLRHGDNDELVIQHGPVAPDYHWLPRKERLDAMIDQAIDSAKGK